MRVKGGYINICLCQWYCIDKLENKMTMFKNKWATVKNARYETNIY